MMKDAKKKQASPPAANTPALAAAKAQCKKDKANPDAWAHLAGIHVKHRQYEAACKACKTALKYNKRHPTAHHIYGIALQHLGLLNEAIEQYRYAIKSNPHLAEAYCNLGTIYYERSDLDAAKEYFNKALEITPWDVDTQFRLADLYERTHDLRQAKLITAKILESHPSHNKTIMLMARLERREGNPQAALNRLQGNNNINRSAEEIAVQEIEIAQLLDEVGRYGEAYELMKRGQRSYSDLFGTYISRSTYIKQIDALRDWVSQTSSIAIQNNHTYPNPVFLVGFPRSGTTLTEQILGSHPKIVTLDEKPVLDETIADLEIILDTSTEYPWNLDLITPANQHVIARQYWERTGIDYQSTDTVFIDKLPLNILHLGFINKVFPDSKIILAMRDPRDVCLSCFMQLFRLNTAMIHFDSYESTAELYDRVMGLMNLYNDKAELNIHISKYEKLIEAPETHIRHMIGFLDCEWDDNVMAYHKKKNRRAVSTPSNAAIAKPIYSRSVGRWQGYADKIESSITRLTPYLMQYEYAR